MVELWLVLSTAITVPAAETHDLDNVMRRQPPGQPEVNCEEKNLKHENAG